MINDDYEDDGIQVFQQHGSVPNYIPKLYLLSTDHGQEEVMPILNTSNNRDERLKRRNPLR